MAKLTTKALDRVSPPARVQKQITFGTGAGGNTPGFDPLAGFGKEKREVDLDVLRAFRAAIPWAAAAMDMRRDQVMHAPWKIGPKDPEKDWSKDVAQAMTDRLESPDPTGMNLSYATLFGPATDDTLAVGRGAIQLWPEEEGNMGGIAKMRPLDGKRVVDNPKWDPDQSEDEADEDGNLINTRYFYQDEKTTTTIGGKIAGKPMKSDEVILMKPNPLSYQKDGLSPMIYLWSFLNAERDVFKAVHLVQRNWMPPGVLKVPNAQPGTVDKLTGMLKERVQGKAGIAVVDIPADADFVPMGQMNLAAQGAFAFYDIIVRGVAAGFRTSTVALGWTFDVNRTTADAQGEFNDEGGLNLLRMIQITLNREYIPRWKDSDNLQFQYTSLPVESEAESVDAVNAWASGVFVVSSPDELRIKAGEDPIKRKEGTLLDRAYKDMWVKTGGTAIPLFLSLGLAPNAMASGYDPETGEIDAEQAAKEAALKAPPGLGPFAAQAAAQGADGKNGGGQPPPDGTTNSAPPPPASDNGAKQVPANGLVPVATRKAFGETEPTGEEEAAMTRELEELDAIFRSRLKEAQRAKRRVALQPADDTHRDGRS